MNRVYLFIFIIFSAFPNGCAEKSTVVASAKDDINSINIKNGDNYSEARESLLGLGWYPVSAICTEKNICWEYPELALNLGSKKNCGVFKKNNREIKICVKAIPDGANVESLEIIGEKKSILK
jgi:hypothetical protein